MDFRDEEIRDESSQLEPRPQARHFQADITWRHHPAADVSSHNGARAGALVGVVCSEELCVKRSGLHVSFTHIAIGTFVNNQHTEPKDFALRKPCTFTRLYWYVRRQSAHRAQEFSPIGGICYTGTSGIFSKRRMGLEKMELVWSNRHCHWL